MNIQSGRIGNNYIAAPTERTQVLSGEENAREFQPGQTIQGKVVQLQEKEVTLRLSDGTRLTARMEDEAGLQPGQDVIMNVKGTSGTGMVLTLLRTNLSQASPVMTALATAGIPFNDSSVEMTKAMMEYGMPIDRESLQEMYQKINHLTDVKPETVVQMQKLGLAITDGNVLNFQAFQNYEGKITDTMGNVWKQTQLLFSDLLQDGKTQEAGILLKDILSVIGIAENTGSLQSAAVSEQDSIRQLTAFHMETEEMYGLERTAETQNAVLTDSDLSFANRYDFVKTLSAYGLSGQNAEQFLEGTLPARELLGEIAQIISRHEIEGELKEALQSRTFTQVLTNAWKEEVYLSPEMTEKETLQNLYGRLERQVRMLTGSLAQQVEAEAPLGQALSNLNQTMDFMNQMNQVYQYIQLPLKMNGMETTGDLFVYTDKKKLAGQDGSVSALLHLDMEHLGAVDVYASMEEGNRVNTRFYLQDEACLDFIAAHIGLLNERLEKKGYHIKSEVTLSANSGKRMQQPKERTKLSDKELIYHGGFHALA